MADELISPAHKQACLVEKREFVVIDRTRNVPCNTKLGQAGVGNSGSWDLRSRFFSK